METKFKGTQGEWEVEERGLAVFAKQRFKSIPFDGQICRLHTGIHTYKNNEANAKLIANAPELLFALQEMIAFAEFHGYTSSTEINNARKVLEETLS